MSEYVDLSDALYGYPLDKVLVIDTETTGLDPYTDEILSIAIVNGRGERLLSTYLRPLTHFSWPEAEAVNGISWSMVKNAPTITEKRDEISTIIDRDDILVVGYNVRFDLKFVGCNIGTCNELHILDVMDLYDEVKTTGRSRLVDCARRYGYEYEAHGALADARATAFCFRQINRDPKYYGPLLEKRFPKNRVWSFAQTKATAESAKSVLGNAKSATFDGKLVIGEITRGKSKGALRYECAVGDDIIGIGTTDMVSHVRRNLSIPKDQTPPSIDATVSLATDRNGSILCEAKFEIVSYERNVIQSLAELAPGPEEEIFDMVKLTNEERAEEEEALMNSQKTEKKSFFKRLFGL